MQPPLGYNVPMNDLSTVNHYLDVLLEKAGHWLDSSSVILNLLEEAKIDGLNDEVKKRTAIIEAYLDCKERLERLVTEEGLEFESQNLFPTLLGYPFLNGTAKAGLNQLKEKMQALRDSEDKISKLAGDLPVAIKKDLLSLQKKKPGINAYHKNQTSILDQFSRFDRKK